MEIHPLDEELEGEYWRIIKYPLDADIVPKTKLSPRDWEWNSGNIHICKAVRDVINERMNMNYLYDERPFGGGHIEYHKYFQSEFTRFLDQFLQVRVLDHFRQPSFSSNPIPTEEEVYRHDPLEYMPESRFGSFIHWQLPKVVTRFWGKKYLACTLKGRRYLTHKGSTVDQIIEKNTKSNDRFSLLLVVLTDLLLKVITDNLYYKHQMRAICHMILSKIGYLVLKTISRDKLKDPEITVPDSVKNLFDQRYRFFQKIHEPIMRKVKNKEVKMVKDIITHIKSIPFEERGPLINVHIRSSGNMEQDELKVRESAKSLGFSGWNTAPISDLCDRINNWFDEFWVG